MSKEKRLWLALFLVFSVSFTVLGLLGGQLYRAAPPIPAKVITQSGEVLLTKADIERGQDAWRSMGGHQQGSIWGHGSYVAPDWSADWLHREALLILDQLAVTQGFENYELAPNATQAMLRAQLQEKVRTNTYDARQDAIIVDEARARAFAELVDYYDRLFSDDPAMQPVREDYAIKENPIPNQEHRQAMAGFFFWTAWSTVTNRPGEDVSYTNNWPHEPLVGNTPQGNLLGWSLISVLFLIAGIGVLAWHHARTKDEHELKAPDQDPLDAMVITPSMKATKKYFWTVIALFLGQILLGGITAHYAVEGQAFYGIQLSDILPYSVVRTWHTQLAVFWVATAWLGTGLYIAPALSGKEPKFQALLVNVLYVALVLVVVGSMAGEWLGVQQVFTLGENFWFGHQGYEFVDLGRFWQILLFAGLLIWLALVTRALSPALKGESEYKPVMWILFLSTIAIGLMYAAGLMMGRHTHIALAEYWRWWVVHLWVEGFFEVFATAVIALLFTRMGLIRAATANAQVIFATAIFLTGGILGTLHHLYFTGAPVSFIAWGAVFSALEVVPLALIGFEAYESYRLGKAAPWVEKYRWPIMFFIGCAFWNLVGAGLLGFLINPPISLYYVQGLNTTPLHGHAAMFGVYGLLGIGLLLFCLRGMSENRFWNDNILKWTFWSLNIGLAAMCFMSLAPVGFLQFFEAVDVSYWAARSPEFLHQDIIHTLVWLRVPGDVLFAWGGLLLALFAWRLQGFGQKAPLPANAY
ncbi:nitric-oxide reductase large subunit [Gallaecimonas sp. GXIMD4217]|uniref:nitric-oxide reductase large subunit n=1 Tax=Gallaecimonas sp. GXIMD4217 TaxID=3131927 RepID=UPI00311AD9D7